MIFNRDLEENKRKSIYTFSGMESHNGFLETGFAFKEILVMVS